jgi:hypothetical protein
MLDTQWSEIMEDQKNENRIIDIMELISSRLGAARRWSTMAIRRRAD